MKSLFKILKLNFDRSFSGSWLMQILWLCLAIFIFGGTLLVLDMIVEKAGLLKGLGEWRVIELFLDPGSFASGEKTEQGNIRFFALLITLVGSILFTSMLISVISNILQQRIERYRSGDISYKFNNHIIILGYNEMVPSLIKTIHAKYPKNDIVILTSDEVESVRHNLFTKIDNSEKKMLVLINDQLDSDEALMKIHVDKAEEVFIIGDTNEIEHDSLNINALKEIALICKSRRRPNALVCNTLLQYQSSFALFQSKDISLEIKNYIYFKPFNTCEMWARKVFVTGESRHNNILNYKPLDYEPITEDSEKTVHLVIAGMTSMGVMLAVEAAYLAHYPNFIKDKCKKTKITMIDIQARTEMEFITGRYRNLFEHCYYSFQKYDGNTVFEKEDFKPKDEFIDIEFEFIEGNVANANIQKKFVEWSNPKRKTLLTIAVCFENSSKNIATGLYFANEIYERQIPILIKQNNSGELLNLIKNSKRYNNVYPFGMLNDGYEMNEMMMDWAKKVNYLYCFYYENNRIPEIYIPEEVERQWDSLTVAKRWSNIYNAITIPTKLRSIGIDYKNIDLQRDLSSEEIKILAEIEHNRWNVEELLLGYRPTNEEENKRIEKDPSEKGRLKKIMIHYDIRPFEDLRADDSGLNVNRFDYGMSEGILDIIR